MGQYKQGLDYFPFTIGLLKDRKLRRPKLKFGCVVNDIYLSLLELIYGDKGYYLVYSNDTKDDIIWEILENLQGKYCPTAETVEQVIGDLVACGLFSGDHFKSEILTSKRIQQTYYSATVERKAVDVDFEIWILSEEEMRKLSSNSLILAKFLNRSNDGANRSNDGANRSNEQESKEKKSITSNEVINIPPPIACASKKEKSEFETKLNAFCEKWGIVIDNCCPLMADFDFEKLDKAYSESKTFLQDKKEHPFAQSLDWIVGHYQAIIGGKKYKDKEETKKPSGKKSQSQQTHDILKNLYDRYKAEEEADDDANH